MHAGVWCTQAYAIKPLGARILLNQGRRAVHAMADNVKKWKALSFPQGVPTPGFRMPIDFVTLHYGPAWLYSHAVNLQRAVSDGIVFDPAETHPYLWSGMNKSDYKFDRMGGIVGQDPLLGTTMYQSV